MKNHQNNNEIEIDNNNNEIKIKNFVLKKIVAKVINNIKLYCNQEEEYKIKTIC